MSPERINRPYGTSARQRNPDSPTNSLGNNNNKNKKTVKKFRGSGVHELIYEEQQRSSIVDIPIVPTTIITTSFNSTTSSSKPLDISMGSNEYYRDLVLPNISDDSTSSNSSSSSTGSNGEQNYISDYVDEKYRFDKNGPQLNEIFFHDDVPHLISNPRVVTDDVATDNSSSLQQQPLSLDLFYQKYRSILPPGLRSDLRTKIAYQNKKKVMKSHKKPREIVTQTILSYRDEKNAIEIFNPWFVYTELLHKCRVDYHVSHRSIDMLTMQSLDKDTLRELFVVLYGQKYMIHAPDLHTEFHHFLTDFWKTFSHHQPEQIWIDLQCLNDTYGPRNPTNNITSNTFSRSQSNTKTNAATSSSKLFVASRNPSIGSLSTIHQCNKSFTRKKEQQNNYQQQQRDASSKPKVLVEL